MNKLKILSLYDKIYYIAIGVLLVSLFQYTFFLIPIYLFYIRKKQIFTITFIIMSIFSIRLIFKHFKSFKIDNNISGIVMDVKESSYIVKLNNQKVILYTNETLSLGDYIKATGNYREINYPTIPFDYNNYYLKHDIKYQFFANKIEKKKRFNIYLVRNNLIKYFDNNYSKISASYYKSLLLGYKNDLEIKEDLNNLGISHLFSISGLHILILVKMLSLFLKKRYINIFLVIYIFITGLSPSVLRASLIVILSNYFTYKKYEFSTLDTLSFIFIFLLFINPYYIYDTGFELSFLITFSIIITEFKKKLLTLKVSILTFLMSLPISINVSGTVNLLTPFYNVLLIGFFSLIFMPITIITSPIRNFKPYELLCELFTKVINILSNIKFSIIDVPKLSSIDIMLYYVSIFIFFKMKKAIYLLVITFFIFMKGKITIGGYVKILDVGQGDSSLIKTNRYTIMIDCYNDSYKYLLNEGIRHIDYLIITHGHEDHAGDLLDIYYSNIKVDTLIVSYYDNSSITLNALNYYKKVIYFKEDDELNLNKLNIKCLAPSKNNSDLNNISLVLKIEVFNKSFLFMGDYELEETLINKDIKCDILKVGHHGAYKAFTKKFIEKANPKIAIISCGAYNKYKHPDSIWINYFKENDIKYHITYINKTYAYRTYIP